jgi:hypothetical protein
MALITGRPTAADVAIANFVASHTNPPAEEAAGTLTWGADDHILSCLTAARTGAQVCLTSNNRHNEPGNRRKKVHHRKTRKSRCKRQLRKPWVRSPQLKRRIKGAEQGTRKKTVSAPRSWGRFFETKLPNRLTAPLRATPGSLASQGLERLRAIRVESALPA